MSATDQAPAVKLPRVWSGGALALPEPPIRNALAKVRAAEIEAQADVTRAAGRLEEAEEWLDLALSEVAEAQDVAWRAEDAAVACMADYRATQRKLRRVRVAKLKIERENGDG